MWYAGMIANCENCKTCGEERKHDAKTGWYCPDCDRERLKRELAAMTNDRDEKKEDALRTFRALVATNDEIEALKTERDEWRDKAIFSSGVMSSAFQALSGEDAPAKALAILREGICSLQPNSGA